MIPDVRCDITEPIRSITQHLVERDEREWLPTDARALGLRKLSRAQLGRTDDPNGVTNTPACVSSSGSSENV